MKKLKVSMLASGLVLAVLSGNTFGEAGISYNAAGKPADVTANVKFKITIPQIMILRVGDWEDTVNEVVWNYAFAGITGGANADATETQWNNTAAAATPTPTDNVLQVAAFGNVGIDLTLTSAIVREFDTDADINTAAVGGQPLLSDITAVGTGGIDHPAAWGDSVPVLATAGGIVRNTDNWTYTYNPTVVPVGGVYTAEVKYTLSAI